MNQKLDKNFQNIKVAVTGGGSGGHTSAASAIIEGIQEELRNPTEQILYIGGTRGMEGEKDTKSIEQKVFENKDIKFYGIRSGKLQRYLSLESIKLLLGVVGGMLDSWIIISRERPDIIISTGGYVTVPVCFVGWLKRTPIYLHEQTAAVGLTNKITSKFAKKVFTSFKSSKKHFPDEKIEHVGNPVRKDVFKADPNSGDVAKKAAKMARRKKEFPILLFTGGGQGSHTINKVVFQSIVELLGNYQVILQTGANKVFNDYKKALKIKNKLDKSKQKRFLPVKYIDANQIGYIFSVTDLHIGRAGANFVYETALLKIPSIFIPIPWVTHNEQTKNAQNLVEAGLAVIIEEQKLSKEILLEKTKKMLDRNSAKASYNSEEIKKLYPENAVERIVRSIKKEFKNK